MRKESVSVVYDRKKTVAKTGIGKIEISIYLGTGGRKYVTIHSCNPFEWKEYQRSKELKEQVAIYRLVLENMIKKGEELTLENLNNHLGCNTSSTM